MNDKLDDTKPRPIATVPAESASPDANQNQPMPSPTPSATPTPRMPQRRVGAHSPIDHAGPPRWLFWGVIGIFVLGMVGIAGAIAAFRFVLEPAQQERVMQVLPFMEEFLPPRPNPGDTLPTPEASGTELLSPQDLLSGLTLSSTTTPADATAEPTLEPTSEPTSALTATLEATSTPSPEVTQPPTQSAVTEPTPAAETVQSTPNNSVVIPRTVRLTGFNYQKQTWNNCGPANVTMALSFYGWQQDQAYAADFLKPGGREDKNVSPEEMVAFVNEQSSVDALSRMGGTIDLLKQFLANNIPVIIESGSMPEGYDWLGHYRTLVGYDDNQGVFFILDSFIGSENPGAGIVESYPDFDDDWQQFNRTFIPVYEPQRQELVERLMGDYMDPTRAAEIALAKATEEATADTTNGHAWYNMGTSLVALGAHERAADAFDRARVAGVPWRMTWYQFGPFEAYHGSGRIQELLSLVSTNLGNGGEYVEETYYWQGRALEAQGRTNEAASAYRTALNRNPRYVAARNALDALGS
ncbi:MAG: C39 family peptidase [Anaerolineae bacterium]|nr:C39 family peptidase [Anaerolineae bacterium]